MAIFLFGADAFALRSTLCDSSTVRCCVPCAGDFLGGNFQTLEADGHLKPHQFELGDALVFVSHKYHCVAPVTAGRRRVLVTELFSGGGGASGEEGESGTAGK